MLVRVGVVAKTLNVRALLVCVPFATVIFGVPATDSKDEEIEAVNCESET